MDTQMKHLSKIESREGTCINPGPVRALSLKSDYCIISTKCSRGVMRDAREHYLAKFTGEILAVTGTKSIHFSPK